jgi:hypothetical protein
MTYLSGQSRREGQPERNLRQMFPQFSAETFLQAFERKRLIKDGNGRKPVIIACIKMKVELTTRGSLSPAFLSGFNISYP